MKFFKGIALLAFGTLFFFQSCSVETETHFNKDMSGSSTSYIDMAGFIDMASSFGGGDESELKEITNLFNNETMPDSMRQSIDSVSLLMQEAGMKNFKMEGYDNKGFKISFDFDDIEILNGSKLAESLADGIGDENAPTEMLGFSQGGSGFSWDGKWLEFRPGGSSMDDMMEAMQEEGDTEMSMEELEATMSMMTGMFGASMDFKQKYTFDRKVKEVQSPFEYTSGKKEVTITYGLSDLMDVMKSEDQPIVRIRLK